MPGFDADEQGEGLLFCRYCGVVLALFFIIAVISCSADLTDGEGDIGDGATDVAVGDVSDTVDVDRGADIGDVEDATGDEDAGGDGETWPEEEYPFDEWWGWVECDCPNPEEKCTPYYCGLPEIDCTPDDDVCPEGYECAELVDSGGVYGCLCEGDEEECAAPSCQEDEDCEEGYCWPLDYVCVDKPLGCFSNVNWTPCPEGYLCEDYGSSSVCKRAGDGDIGEPCDDGVDCFSGICHDGICDEQCLTDEDCAEGTHCRDLAERDHNGCRGPECPFTCPPGERCSNHAGNPTCVPPFCVTTGDCDTGDCRQHPDRPDVIPPGCVEPDESDVDRYCKPEERYHERTEMCYLPGPCWRQAHCHEPYQCSWRGGDCWRPADLETE